FLYEDYPDYVEDYSNEKKEDDSDNQNENPVDKSKIKNILMW
ncbi:hypothetical protein NPIL_44751, partial [Nephila pilipes]